MYLKKFNIFGENYTEETLEKLFEVKKIYDNLKCVFSNPTELKNCRNNRHKTNCFLGCALFFDDD